MPHRKDKEEEQAIALLRQVIDISERDRDALPGSAVSHVKDALTIMRKRRRRSGPGGKVPSGPEGSR